MPRIVPSQVVALINKVFPEASAKSPSDQFALDNSHATPLAGIVRLIDKLPDELMRLDSDQYAEFIAALEGVRQSLATWPHQGAGHKLKKVRGLYKLNPVVILRRALAACPDDYPPVEVAGLEFLDDARLRENVRIDLATINRAFGNHEYKAATVLSGSAIEALLLWALERRERIHIDTAAKRANEQGWLSRIPKGDLTSQDFGLREYAEICGELEIVTKATRSALRLATNFRNLIHPGRAKRLNETCDRGTALTTMGGLELVLRDLSGNAHGRL